MADAERSIDIILRGRDEATAAVQKVGTSIDKIAGVSIGKLVAIRSAAAAFELTGTLAKIMSDNIEKSLKTSGDAVTEFLESQISMKESFGELVGIIPIVGDLL